MIQHGRVPHRIDLLTSIIGVSETEAFATSVAGELDGLPVKFLSRASLVANKRSGGRPQHLADLAALRGEAQ